MKFSVSFFQPSLRFQFSALALVALLQRTPVLRVAAAAGDFAFASPAGALLRSAVTAAASLGALHSLAGATQFVQNPPNPVRGTVGQPFSVAFTITGSPAAPNSFTINDPLPGGLRTIPELQGNTVFSGTPVITGTPTEAGTFSVSVTGSDGAFSQTDTIVFVIAAGASTAPAITTQPAAQTVTAGASVTFTVVATGSPPPTFQWRKDGAALLGATDATLSLANVQPADAGAYSVLVTNAAGTVASNNAALTVNAATIAASITTPPASQTASVGATVTFTVVATGSPTLAFQWRKDTVAIAGATSATLVLANVQPASAGAYSVVVANSGATVTSVSATLTVNAAPLAAPVFTAQPAPQTIASGGTVVFGALATGATAYQWRRDGAPLAGATVASLVLTGANALAGSYTVVATNAVGSATSNAASLTLSATANFGRLINLSILTDITAASPTFTVGTVIGGGGTSGAKPLLVRAVGPSLVPLGLPAASVLADPKLEIFAGTASFASNDNWGGDAALVGAFAAVGAFPFAAATSKDAAVFNAGVASGSYTVQVGNVGAVGGTVVIAEIYDATPAASFGATTPRLVNVSVLKQIGTGATLTAGFVIGGATARTVLVRAVGPALAAFGVGGAMADPKLELFSGQTVIAANDNWGGDAQLTATGTAVGAFGIANAASKDAILLVTLAPGSYTAQVSGVGGGGTALVEVYEVP